MGNRIKSFCFCVSLIYSLFSNYIETHNEVMETEYLENKFVLIVSTETKTHVNKDFTTKFFL